MEKMVGKSTKDSKNTTRILESKANVKFMEVLCDKQKLFDIYKPFLKFLYIAIVCSIEIMFLISSFRRV
jgi:hypothetical protein